MVLQLEGHKLIHHLKEVYKWGEGNLKVPLHFDFGPTTACNINCVHCYVKDLPEYSTYLPRKTYERLMVDMPAAGVKSIFLAGRGDPLMHKDTQDMIPIGNKAGLDIGLLTNGVIFKPQISEKLLEHLVFTRFNILGAKPDTYSKLMGTSKNNLKNVFDNIQHAVQYRAKNSIKTTLGVYFCMFPENALEMYELARIGKDIGLDYFEAKPAGQTIDGRWQTKRSLHIKEYIKEELDKTDALSDENFKVSIRMDSFDVTVATHREYDKCYGIDFLGIIDADGSVGACNGMWQNPKAVYGNVNKKNFKDIWESEQRWNARDYIIDEVTPHRCYRCRQHAINDFLWKIKNPPEHLNFI